MMGSGKTNVGRALAANLGWRFVDTDGEIVAAEGRAIADIFAIDGENAFRDMETAAILNATSGEHAVIATGGGAILREENRTALYERCWVVWLAATPEEHVRRVLNSERRPVLERYADPVEGAREVLAARISHYSQADLTVDTTNLGIPAVVSAILAAFPR
jgi:shikimate kinase